MAKVLSASRIKSVNQNDTTAELRARLPFRGLPNSACACGVDIKVILWTEQTFKFLLLFAYSSALFLPVQHGLATSPCALWGMCVCAGIGDAGGLRTAFRAGYEHGQVRRSIGGAFEATLRAA